MLASFSRLDTGTRRDNGRMLEVPVRLTVRAWIGRRPLGHVGWQLLCCGRLAGVFGELFWHGKLLCRVLLVLQHFPARPSGGWPRSELLGGRQFGLKRYGRPLLRVPSRFS